MGLYMFPGSDYLFRRGPGLKIRKHRKLFEMENSVRDSDIAVNSSGLSWKKVAMTKFGIHKRFTLNKWDSAFCRLENPRYLFFCGGVDYMNGSLESNSCKECYVVDSDTGLVSRK